MSGGFSSYRKGTRGVNKEMFEKQTSINLSIGCYAVISLFSRLMQSYGIDVEILHADYLNVKIQLNLNFLREASRFDLPFYDRLH